MSEDVSAHRRVMKSLPVCCYEESAAAGQIGAARKKCEDSNAAFSIEVIALRRHERDNKFS
jgi:hypothetical protein